MPDEFVTFLLLVLSLVGKQILQSRGFSRKGLTKASTNGAMQSYQGAEPLPETFARDRIVVVEEKVEELTEIVDRLQETEEDRAEEMRTGYARLELKIDQNNTAVLNRFMDMTGEIGELKGTVASIARQTETIIAMLMGSVKGPNV